MAKSFSRKTPSPLEAVRQAIGHSFVWLRMEEDRTQCVVWAGDLAIPPITYPAGRRALVEAFAQALDATPYQSAELLACGGLAFDPGFRQIAADRLHPLGARLAEILTSVASCDAPVSHVVLDMPGGPLPGLAQVVNEMCPGTEVVALDDLGIASPNKLPSESAEVEEINEVPEAAPPDAPAAAPGFIPPLEREPAPSGNAFVAWMAVLGALGFTGLMAVQYRRMGQLNNNVLAVIQQMESMRQEQAANLPALRSQPQSGASLVFPTLPPIPAGLGAALPPMRTRLPIAALPALPPPVLHLPRALAFARAHQPPLSPLLTQALPPVPSSLPPAARRASVTLALPAPGKPAPLLPIPAASAEALTALNPPAEPSALTGPVPTGPAVDMAPPAILPPRLAGYVAHAAVAMSLGDVFQQAAERSFAVEAAQWRRKAADAVSANALTPYRPKWSLDAGLFTGANLLSAQSGVATTSMGAFGSLDIDLAGRKKLLRKSAAAVHARTSAEVEASRSDARYGAAIAYLDALRARDEVAGLQELLTVAQEQWRVASARSAEGQISPLDVAEAASHVADTQDELAAARSRQENAELQLAGVVQAQPGSRVKPQPVDVWLPTLTAGLESRQALALAQTRPDVRLAAARVTEAQVSLQLRRKSRAPRLSAFGGMTFLDTAGVRPQPTIGIRFSVPFGDGGDTRYGLREAGAVLGEARTLYRQALQTAAQEIATAQVDLRDARRQAGSADIALDTGREGMRVAQQRYAAGFATFTDVLQAEAQLSAALRGNVERKQSVLRAQLDLLHATGRLSVAGNAAGNGSA